MKKHLMVLGLLLICITTAKSVEAYPTKENNPLFYQPMTFHAHLEKWSEWIKPSRLPDVLIISATGIIQEDTPDKFKMFLSNICNRIDCSKIANKHDTIFLHSPGGHVLGGLELGRILREYGYTTIVEKPRYAENINKQHNPYDGLAYCESACAYTFLGGKSRRLEYLSLQYDRRPSKGQIGKIGLHQFARKMCVVVPRILPLGASLVRRGRAAPVATPCHSCKNNLLSVV